MSNEENNQIIQPTWDEAEAAPAEAQPESAVPVEHTEAPVPAQPEVGEKELTPESIAASRVSVARQKLNIQSSMFVETKDDPATADLRISLPAATLKATLDALQSADRQRTVDPMWRASVDEATTNLYSDGEYEEALSREGASWTNAVPVPDGKKGFIVPMRLTPSLTGDNSKGDRAVLAMNHYLNLGGPVRMPYWNSGFWASLRPLSDVTIYNLVREATSAKINLGRLTYAASFSDYMVSSVEIFFATFRAHLANTTLANFDDIGDLLKVTDIPTMMLHLAASVYPNGFEYSRSCVADYSKCQHVSTGKLIPNRCLIVDHARFDEAQLRFMMNYANGISTKEKVLEYQKSLQDELLSSVLITGSSGGQIRVKFKVPSINTFIASGKEWLSVISNSANVALGMQASVEEKNSYMYDIASAMKSRSISHWVESLEIAPDSANPSVFDNQETIDQLLSESLSRDAKASQELADAVLKFMERVSRTIVGILNYKCPNCQSTQYDVKDAEGNIVEEPTIIPLDIQSTFFELLRLISDRIRQQA